MRPAALRRGAIWNATWRALGGVAPTVKAGDIEQRAQAGVAHLVEPAQAVSHQDAVLAGERNHVGHGGNRRQLEERFRDAPDLLGRPAHVRQKRLDQLEGHTGAAQVLFRVRAIRAIGIEHGERGREVGLGQVMVGDDDVDAEFVGAAHHFGGADAGIHADNQLHPLFGGGLHHFAPHAVAVLQAVRHVIRGGAAGEFEGLGEEHHAGGAVDVVVAVDQDALALADGARDALNGDRHVAQGQRIVQFFEGRVQEAVGGRGVGESAVHQHLGGRRPDFEGGRQSGDSVGIGRGQHPARRRTNSWSNTRQASRLRPDRPRPGRSRYRLPRPGIPRTSRAGVRTRRGWNRG